MRDGWESAGQKWEIGGRQWKKGRSAGREGRGGGGWKQVATGRDETQWHDTGRACDAALFLDSRHQHAQVRLRCRECCMIGGEEQYENVSSIS